MKLIFILFTLLVTTSLHSQIAINTESPQSLFHVDSQGNTSGTTNVSDDVVISGDGHLGVGTIAPSTRLDIRGLLSQTIRIVDGTQTDGSVLTSDANGVGGWKVPTNGTFISTEGVAESIQLVNSTTWFRTNTTIDIPPNTSCIIWAMAQFCRLSSVDGNPRQVTVSLAFSKTDATFTNASSSGQVIQNKFYTLNNNCMMCNGFITDIKNNSSTQTLTLRLYANTDQTDQFMYYHPNNTYNDIRLYAVLFQ